MSHSLHQYQCCTGTTLDYYHSNAVVLHFPDLHFPTIVTFVPPFPVPHFQSTQD